MDERVRALNERDFRAKAAFVLYWPQMNRRVNSNHALEFAAKLANDRGLPLLVYEGLTCTYPFANDRMHTFVLEGVPEMARRLKARGIGYHFFLRRTRKSANDLLYKMAACAAAIVTDDYPTFIARRHNASVPGKVDIPYIVVDSSCIVPMSRIDKREYAAYTIRPKIHRMLAHYLQPVEVVPVRREFKLDLQEEATQVTDANVPELVASCEIDHGVKPSLSYSGGMLAAERHLNEFLEHRLARYNSDKNEPSKHATSDLSPYLHFGHISSLEVALRTKDHVGEHTAQADAFLEELIVRRELAFNYAARVSDLESMGNVPDWARKTMDEHARDRRDFTYSREQFEAAQTHDPLWNATQKELLLRGKIHGYYRMYWGKKIMEWSAGYGEALETMIRLHDQYALDGRDPNTYTNILWCFGLHDRPWGTRSVFGMLRYMSYEGMKRKTNVEAYLKEIEFLERTGKDPFRVN